MSVPHNSAQAYAIGEMGALSDNRRTILFRRDGRVIVERLVTRKMENGFDGICPSTEGSQPEEFGHR